MTEMDFRPFQEHTKELKAAQGWDDLSPVQRLAFVIQEVGELASEVRAVGREDVHEINERIGMEIYDVIWNLCDLANILEIDLQQYFEKKIALNRQRAWRGE